MFMCRYFNREDSPTVLHVHDEPAHQADLLRHIQNGWMTHPLGQCAMPNYPYRMGDTTNESGCLPHVKRYRLGLV